MKKISKYQVFSELQHGPITHVYQAMQPELQRVVLVKQLNPDRITDEELVERFRQEGLILAKINSPNVITIFDFGFEDRVPFLVTEFIEGNTLAALIQQNGALPWDVGLFMLQQLAQGLNAIHHQNIIHQDIKPDNIFISNEGEVKLGDLGFSVTLDQVDQQIQGTPAYLAPEVVEGLPVDFRSDLYSLGLVGYEMLTGENPFAADDMPTVLNRIVNLKPMSAHAVRPEVPERLSSLVVKLMARNSADRFQSAREFSQALENLKISMGIKIDGNCLVSFMDNPDQYQASPIIMAELAKPSIQQAQKRKIPILVIGVIIIGLLIVLFGKLMNKGFNFLSDKADTTRISKQESVNQPINPNDISVATDQNKIESAAKIAKEEVGISNKKNLEADILKMPGDIVARVDTLVITTDPRAFVFQSGDSLGITPLPVIFDAQTNLLEIELHAPGFPIIKKSVTNADRTVQNIHISLWQEVGYLDIEIIPWGTIWVDGDSIDVSPIDHPLVLSPGNHRLMVKHPSLKGITEPFYVAVGETLKKTIQLQRAR